MRDQHNSRGANAGTPTENRAIDGEPVPMGSPSFFSGGASDLLRELEEAEARVLQLRQRITHSTCAEVGHDWKHIGGRNAACSRGRDCMCSIPVHECAKCGDCDYGDNEEAADTINGCDLTHDDANPDTREAARTIHSEQAHG